MRIQGVASSKADFLRFQAAVRDTDKLLREDGMAERRAPEKRREARGSPYDFQKKRKTSGVERYRPC